MFSFPCRQGAVCFGSGRKNVFAEVRETCRSAQNHGSRPLSQQPFQQKRKTKHVSSDANFGSVPPGLNIFKMLLMLSN